MYKIITLDFWDTLVENKSYKKKRIDALYNFLSKKCEKINFDNINNSYKQLNEYLGVVNKTESNRWVSIQERLNFIFDKLKIDINKEEIDIITDIFQVIALEDPPLLKNNIKEVLEKLCRNYSLGIISDTGFTCGNTVREFLKSSDIYKYFNQCH